MMPNHTDSPEAPHSPDVAERETSDGGFSAGWGFHMKPSVRYWLDCHTHMRESSVSQILQAVEQWHRYMWAHRLRRHAGVDGSDERCEAFAAAAQADDRFLWLCRIPHDKPDQEHLDRCKTLGAVGIKLHNAPIITRGEDRKVVLSDDWHGIYERAGALRMPVLWHVTQRLTDSPYTGGGRNSYWKDGWEKGVRYTNQDILDDFLEVVSSHRRTAFIGAHQLHVGPERLSELFGTHPNLYSDTSIGCFVAADDRMYPTDHARWRDFFIRNADRMCFGTDSVIGQQTASTELLRQHLLGHVRFLKHLDLPQDALSKVAHGNFERLAGLEPVDPFPWGALRP